MVAISSPLNVGSVAASGALNLDFNAVDSNAAIGQPIGRLSVSLGGDWRYSLEDDSEGMFSLSASELLVGATKLDHNLFPAPRVRVSATDGEQTIRATFSVNVRRPLPELPLATGAVVVAIGDSQIAFNTFQSGGVPIEGANKNALGFITHAQSLDPRFRWENWYEPNDPTGRNIGGGNQGVMGDHMTVSPKSAPQLGGVVGRLPSVLARNPDIIILEGGTNTISTGDGGDGSAALIIKSLDDMLTQSRNAGVHSILMTVYPRLKWQMSDTRRQATLKEVNSWIRSQVGRDGLLAVLDADSVLLDDEGQVDLSKFQSDQIHLNINGANALARVGLLPILQKSIKKGSVFDQNPASDNLFGVSKGRLLGADGVKGRNTVGKVASGCVVASGFNASSVVASKEFVDGAVEVQVLDITPADVSSDAAYGSVIFSPEPLISPNIAGGEWVQGYIHVQSDSSDALALARWQVAVRQGSNSRNRSYGHNASSGNFTTKVQGNGSFWLMTEPMQVTPDLTFDRIHTSLEVFFDKTSEPFKVKISRPIVRKIQDPRPSWGY